MVNLQHNICIFIATEMIAFALGKKRNLQKLWQSLAFFIRNKLSTFPFVKQEESITIEHGKFTTEEEITTQKRQLMNKEDITRIRKKALWCQQIGYKQIQITTAK